VTKRYRVSTTDVAERAKTRRPERASTRAAAFAATFRLHPTVRSPLRREREREAFCIHGEALARLRRKIDGRVKVCRQRHGIFTGESGRARVEQGARHPRRLSRGEREEFRFLRLRNRRLYASAPGPGGVATLASLGCPSSSWYPRTSACIGEPPATIAASAARMSNGTSARCIESESAIRTKTGAMTTCWTDQVRIRLSTPLATSIWGWCNDSENTCVITNRNFYYCVYFRSRGDGMRGVGYI